MVAGTLQASLDVLVRRYRFDEPIYITRPSLPDLERYRERLEPAWESAWLTNDGALAGELREAIAAYLGVEELSLFCNGTLALLVALQAAGIDGGEVITTPFTFPATPHALHWNRVRPVFCDIREPTLTLDPERIEALIGPDTRAILPVHVFGNACDVEAIEQIGAGHGLPVIYDAAHAMGVRYRGESLLRWGDYSILSFHATKLFSTAEGGAIVSPSARKRERVDFLKNFGIADEDTVIGPGINGKLNELQAAFGLLQLEDLDDEIAKRAELAGIYRRRFEGVAGLTIPEESPELQRNYAYYPILVDPVAKQAGGFGISRDQLWESLKSFNIMTRKYFWPLCSHYDCYASLPSARPENLPVAERVSESVLCLPLYGGLEPEAALRIACVVEAIHDVC